MTLDASAAKAGASVELRFEMDTLVLFHTCPHPLNRSPVYPRKPVRYEIFEGPPAAADDPKPAVGAGEHARLREQPHLPYRLLRGRVTMIKESPLDPDAALYRRVVPAGEYWIHVVRKGETLRIVDLEGNQAADTLFYNADDPAEHYSASDTIREQGNIYLSTGTCPQIRSLPADADHHRRHRRPPRHAWRRLLDREQHRPLRARQEIDACLPRQLPARGRRERPLRARQARHRAQHQFLHECAGDAGRRA